jgi:hypothetical protein
MKDELKKFYPLLILYILLIFLFYSTTVQDDREKYVSYANRIVQRDYFSQDDVEIWWGPGYPLVLAPFVYMNLPLYAAKVLNAFFQFGAMIYFYKTLKLFLEKKHAVILTFSLGLYPPLLREIHLIYTESLVFFLIGGSMYHYCRMSREPRKFKIHMLLSSLYFGYLALTKIFFGYVLLAGMILYLFLFTVRREDRFKKTTLVYALALIWCIPYLLLTFSHTGKVFYWGTSGGMSLYWMSTPYDREYGDWFSSISVKNRPELSQHREFFEEIATLSNVERDEAFRLQALENILSNPIKFIANWFANIGRLFFSYPFSYTNQKLSTYFYIFPNIFIFVLLAFSIYPAIKRRRAIPYELYSLAIFALISLGGTSLLSAYNRQFRPIVPIILLWLSFIYIRVLRIEMRTDTEIARSTEG